MSNKRPLVVAYGGGRNSTAMLIGLHVRGIKPSLITFADTGGEKPSTYAYLRRFGNWLTRHDMGEIVKVRASRKFETLEAECLARGQLPSLVYGVRSCSQAWKHLPQRQEAKRRLGDADLLWAIGFDAGEAHRAKEYPDQCYPLIEWGWGLDECIAGDHRRRAMPPPKVILFLLPGQ